MLMTENRECKPKGCSSPIRPGVRQLPSSLALWQLKTHATSTNQGRRCPLPLRAELENCDRKDTNCSKFRGRVLNSWSARIRCKHLAILGGCAECGWRVVRSTAAMRCSEPARQNRIWQLHPTEPSCGIQRCAGLAAFSLSAFNPATARSSEYL
jgi:hypothetical protein